MRDFASIVIWLFVASFWEVVVAPLVSIYGVKPDIGMIIVIYMALFNRNPVALIFGFFWGVVVDSMVPGNLGWSALLYLLVGYGIGHISTRFHWGTFAAQILLVFGAVAFYQTGHFVVLNFDEPNTFVFHFVRYGLTTALYSTLIWGLLRYFPGIHQVGKAA
ncbi:MAG: rod shape-determining protein MreD [candidate division Zixibacteria bacterium CG_4_9_14_3_um_filter_46_8]|nr:MAG: rod shape-determining protein MreD [candidate division Zixibacteria bacterium CG_4_9_14_3_um_filter_46_8]